MNKLIDKIKNIKNNKGFTLVELIVVIAILAVITVVVAPQYLGYVEKARIGTDENALSEIAHVTEIAYVELQSDRDTTNDSIKKVEIKISAGTAMYTSNALADLVDDTIPAGQYKFKSDKYKAGTATITIENGAAKVNTTTNLPFEWVAN